MKKIGILGGGQLAQLLSRQAQKLTQEPVQSQARKPSQKPNQKQKLWVLSPSNKDPASLNNPFWTKGDPHNPAQLKAFFKKIDILSFESEFFKASLLKQALKNTKLKVCPSLDNLHKLQDRYRQKQELLKHKIPTLDFIPLRFKNQKEQKLALLKLYTKWGAFVLKTRFGGYDGYGTFVIKNPNSIESLKLPQEASFIAEKFLKFKRELAILSARNQKGQVIFFPLVESYQKNSICLWVKGPVQHKGLMALKKQIRAFLQKIDYQGLIAFELFESPSSQLIVNELAPRVHNTGHYSLSALDQDQFCVHLKAISNQELKSPKLKTQGFAMLNLLGTACQKPTFKNKDLLSQRDFLRQKGFDLYWYGKSESRWGRKMGHINRCASSPDQALAELIKIKKALKV